MADNFSWDVVVRLAVQGAKQSRGEVEGLSDAIDEMARTGKVSEKAVEQTSRELTKMGSAARSTTGDVSKTTESVNALRYANYDLARSMFTVSAGITAAGVGVVAAAASFESSFTAVERTTGIVGDSVNVLREDLIQLTREIPQSFGEISNIAARGAQLGIMADEIKDFTEVVAQFVATSDTVSLDQAVEAFGRISNLTGERDFNALGSAITLVGVNAAATEAQIVKTTQELAPFAAAAGMSTADVIGLSAAVASLGQPPERARSAFLTLQRVVDGAVNGMNDNLGDFARLLGMTEGQVAALWQQDPGAFVQSFTKALGTVDNLTVAFDDLGINERRAVQVFQALAADSRNAGAGMSVLDSAIRDSNQGFNEGTELQRQYALILDDLSSKWTIFLNALMEVAVAIGGHLMPMVKALLDGITPVLQGFAEFAASDIGGAIIRIASSMAGLVAAYAAIRGVIALATGSALAFNFVIGSTGGAGIIAGLRGLGSAFGFVGASAGGAATKTALFGKALRAVGKATIIIGLLQFLIQLVTDLGGTMQWLAGVATQVVNFIGTVFGQMVNFVADAIGALANITFTPAWKSALQDASNEVRNFASEFEKVGLGDVALGGFRDWADTLPRASDGMEEFTNAAEMADWAAYAEGADDFSDGLGGPGGVGDSAAGAAREVRTLVDYANDLQSVFSRAFELRFSSQSTFDAITSAFISIREATEESARNIRRLKAELQGLQSDLSTQKYFLGIALEYGDTARAEAIQANIAKIQADIADKTADLSDEQTKNSKTLTGNSKAALENRKTMEELVKAYQDHLVALASSGMSQAELARRSQQLRQQFIQQATQLGYNRTEVEKYAKAFDDMGQIIRRIPRNVTVSLSTNAADQAIREFQARMKSLANQKYSGGTITAPKIDDSSLKKDARGKYYQSVIATLTREILEGRVPLSQYANKVNRINELKNLLNSGNYYSGGYTGRGGKYEPAGVVHRGEYVIPKEQVNQRTGLPYADALGKLQAGRGGNSYARGGYVQPAPSAAMAGQVTGYGPMAVQQMQAMLNESMRVYLDGQKVSENSARNYATSTARGEN